MLWGVCALGWPLSARAQSPSTTLSTCINRPAAVPGLSGAPNWFTSNPASFDDPTGSRLDIDEPRWAGAALMPFEGVLSAGSPTYRILRHGNYLYLSFHSPTGSAGGDRVYFGFSEGIGTPSTPLSKKAYLIELQPAAPESGSDPIPTPVLQIQAFTPGGTWLPAATPDWIENVSTWRSPSTGLAFGVNFRIDTTKVAIPTGRTFRAFFGMGLRVEPAHTIEFSTPPVSGLTTNFVNSGIHVPADYTQWALYEGLDVACREGITIDTYNIHTGHPNGCSLYTGDPVAQNTFTVEPQTIRGHVPQFANNIVLVQLALAEWGSMYADSQANWLVVPGSNNTTGGWSWTWATPGGPPANRTGAASTAFTCDLLGNPYCPTLNLSDPASVVPPAVVNQALLATLSIDMTKANAELLRVKRASALLNMIPVPLSEDKRKATISLRGLPKPKDAKQTHRDVYIRVVRRNMPPHGDMMVQPPLEERRRIQRFLRSPAPSPFEFPEVEPAPNTDPVKGALQQTKTALPRDNYGKPQKSGESKPPSKPQDQPDSKDERGATLPENLPLEYSSATQHEIVSRALPVYEVHAYYETGETIPDKRGKPRKALKALAPFGYVLHHDTPFYGFTDQIKGVGSALSEVQPGLYKVSVPVDGSVQIETTIRAEEQPLHANCCNQKPPVVHVHVNPRGCYCTTPGNSGDGSKLLPLAVLPVALLIWRRRRRSKA